MKVFDSFTKIGSKSLEDNSRNVNVSLTRQIPSLNVKTTSKMDSDVPMLSRSKSVKSAEQKVDIKFIKFV